MASGSKILVNALEAGIGILTINLVSKDKERSLRQLLHRELQCVSRYDVGESI
jgi:hypothetical protein